MCQIESPFATALREEEEELSFEPTGGIFEVKFLLTEEAVLALTECARQHLAPDPHAMSAEGDGYTVHSLYLDDEQFATYFATGAERLPKYRIRRYGDAETVFLERKSKPDGKVKKHRTLVHADDLAYLGGVEPPEDWSGRWFRKRMRKRGLHPVCFISYNRTARLGRIEDQYVRFTLDKDILCTPALNMGLPGPLNGGATRLDTVIAEIKFEHSLPAPFAEVVERLNLVSAPVSKYKRGVEVCSLVSALLDDVAHKNSPGGDNLGAN